MAEKHCLVVKSVEKVLERNKRQGLGYWVLRWKVRADPGYCSEAIQTADMHSSINRFNALKRLLAAVRGRPARFKIKDSQSSKDLIILLVSRLHHNLKLSAFSSLLLASHQVLLQNCLVLHGTCL